MRRYDKKLTDKEKEVLCIEECKIPSCLCHERRKMFNNAVARIIKQSGEFNGQ